MTPKQAQVGRRAGVTVDGQPVQGIIAHVAGTTAWVSLPAAPYQVRAAVRSLVKVVSYAR